VDYFLNRLKNKDDDFFDGIHPFKTGVKTLSIKRDSSLFKKCVNQDFDYLMSRKFAVDREVLEKLLIQSVLGRAYYGHGWFVDDDGYSLRFLDVSFDAICTVLEERYPKLNSIDVRKFRDELVEHFVKEVLDNLEKETFILVKDKSPFFGVDFLKSFEKVNSRDFLKGMIIAGMMDDYNIRRKTLFKYINDFEGYPLELGGGEIIPADRNKLMKLGLKDTENKEFSKAELEYLADLGVIGEKGKFYNYPEFDSVYFRRRLGEGVCDDLAMIYIGKKYGVDAMLGAFLMDAVDTYDKFITRTIFGGMDGYLAEKIWRVLGNDFLCIDEILECIYFSAKMNYPSLKLSSSHRRFVQIENGASKPTFLMHLDFLQGKTMPDFRLGYIRMKSKEFYEIAKKRLESVGLTD